MIDNCTLAKGSAESQSLQIALIFKTAGCFCAIIASVYYTFKQGIRWLAHPNAKVLFCFHSFWAIYLPLCYFFDCGFDALRLILYKNRPCDLLISTKLAVPMRAIPVLGLVSQSFTMFAFAMERAIATCQPSKYEKIKNPRIGFCLGIMAVVFAVLEEYLCILRPTDWSKQIPLTAIRTADNGTEYQLFLLGYTITEIITISTFIISLWVNNRRSSHNGRYGKGLASKYQVNENRHIIKTLLPCFCIHFCVNIITMLGLQFYTWVWQYNFADFTVWVEWSVQMHLYSILMPIFVQIRLKCRKSRRVTDSNTNDAYYNQLRIMFDTKNP